MHATRKGHRRQACLRCRASKVRCDVAESKDETCTRCRQSNAVCEIAPLHRKFDKRRDVEANVKRAVPSLRPAPPLSSRPKDGTLMDAQNMTSEQVNDTTMTSKTAAPSHSDPGYGSSLAQGSGKARNLDGLFLDGLTIKTLFDKFVSEYLAGVPFLERPIEPDICFNRSPLLFWSIITVAARRSDLDTELVLEITRRTVALATSMSNAPSISTIESLLLLLTWWLPTIGAIAEIPAVMAGTTLHLAMRIGLHNPIRSQDSLRVRIQLTLEDLRHREDIWLHTILLYQKYWSISGTPCEAFSKLGPDPHKIPKDKRGLFTYQRALLDITTSSLEVLARESQKAEAEEPVHIDSHIKLADERLITMKPPDNEGRPSFEGLYWAISRLLIYSHHLHQPLPGPTEMTLELYHTAFTVLTQMQSLAQCVPQFPSTGTLYEFQCSIVAMTTIVRLINIPSFAALVDKDASDNLLDSTVSLQSAFAFGTRHVNLASRLGLMVRMIGSSDVVFRDENGQLCLELRIKTCGPVSVMHDCAWWVRQLVDPRMNAYHGKLPAYMQAIKAGKRDPIQNPQSLVGAADTSTAAIVPSVDRPSTNEARVSPIGAQPSATGLNWSTSEPSAQVMLELPLYQDAGLSDFDWDVFDSIFWSNA